jgi:dihydroneopterin aldolase
MGSPGGLADSVAVMPDVIEIRGLRVLGIIGVNPEERDRAQPFELDVDLEADLSIAGKSDDLADTVDYGLAVGVAERVVRTERHLLLERVAQRVADELLALDRVDSVTVTIRKVRPPLPQDVTTSAVTITRRRSPA